jgi:integrase
MSSYDLIPTLLDFEEWLQARNLSDSSVYVYTAAVKKFLVSGPNLESIDDYNTFIFEHSIKKRSNYFYDALKLFIKFKFDKNPKQHILLRNLLKPKVLDPKKHIHYLDDETRGGIVKLLTNYKHRIMARIQNATGVRAGDILRLKRGAISYESYNDAVVVMRIDFEGKGKKHFIKWIFDADIQTQIDLFIKANILDTEYYFLERRDGKSEFQDMKQNYHHYLDDLKQALKTYGVEYQQWATHDFRRSFARNVWNNSKDPVLLKEMLNHQQFDTTLRYLRGSGLQVKDVYYQLSQK